MELMALGDKFFHALFNQLGILSNGGYKFRCF
jgi:hypothetical protein